jgi:hypothetical protein
MYLTPPIRRRRGLGAVNAAQGISIAGTVGGSVIAHTAALGAVAGPIGAGVAALVGILAGLWAAHSARAKGAKTENTAVNSAVQAFDASLKAIFQAANSGQIAATDAIGLCQQTLQNYWAGMAPFMSGAGRADASGGGSNCGTFNPSAPCAGMLNGHYCDAKCTAGCCVGCQNLAPSIYQAIAVFQAGGGTANICPIASSKYGASARGGYSLTYKAPSATSSVGGFEDALASSLGAASGGGLPIWVLLAGAGVAIWALRR